ncbi:MAG TPA: Mov34/MPN/PAD-1 family protein, partial [Isosphaeraceae bacterium]|nr:Mov34/MPN/PAD-1 family protein [Isosphaeraceae bacterium]
MSNDDIVFGDVSFREPARLRRPDFDDRWACIAYQVPGPNDLPIYLDYLTADAIERHALRDTSVELGGILLGQECVDEVTGLPFVWVTKSLEAKHYENTQSSFTYTHESWEEITRERDRQYPDLHIVGWYHTHPDFGIFLSSHDQFIHRHFFAQPLQVAYVVDPIRQTRGFFQWRNDDLDQVGGYYLTADRGDRLALARLVNDLENIPNASAGGGGLSPRLEAELIAMLTRPSYPAIAADRGQSAAVFTLLGALVGVLGMAGVLWLSTLGAKVQEQNESLKSLKEEIAKSETTHRKALDVARVEAKEAALDTLLQDVHAGASTESFATRFADVSRERDEALLENRKLRVANDSIYNTDQQLKTDINAEKKKVAELEAKNKKLREFEDEVD